MKVFPQGIYDHVTGKNTWFGIDMEEGCGQAYDKAMFAIESSDRFVDEDPERYEYFGNEKEIRFVWDMNTDEFRALMKPEETDYEEPDYMGALFFGNFKLEFMGNYHNGWYLNLFQYGAEDDPGRAYAYLEDGTPYEERYPVSEQIRIHHRRTFNAFAENIERQIISFLNNNPEFIPDALKTTVPSIWYPSERQNYIKNFTRII